MANKSKSKIFEENFWQSCTPDPNSQTIVQSQSVEQFTKSALHCTSKMANNESTSGGASPGLSPTSMPSTVEIDEACLKSSSPKEENSKPPAHEFSTTVEDATQSDSPSPQLPNIEEDESKSQPQPAPEPQSEGSTFSTPKSSLDFDDLILPPLPPFPTISTPLPRDLETFTLALKTHHYHLLSLSNDYQDHTSFLLSLYHELQSRNLVPSDDNAQGVHLSPELAKLIVTHLIFFRDECIQDQKDLIATSTSLAKHKLKIEDGYAKLVAMRESLLGELDQRVRKELMEVRRAAKALRQRDEDLRRYRRQVSRLQGLSEEEMRSLMKLTKEALENVKPRRSFGFVRSVVWFFTCLVLAMSLAGGVVYFRPDLIHLQRPKDLAIIAAYILIFALIIFRSVAEVYFLKPSSEKRKALESATDFLAAKEPKKSSIPRTPPPLNTAKTVRFSDWNDIYKTPYPSVTEESLMADESGRRFAFSGPDSPLSPKRGRNRQKEKKARKERADGFGSLSG